MATIKSVSNFDGTHVYDYVGNSEETKPEGANVGENSTFTELDTGRQFFKKGSAWANMTSPGGGSSGGGLPINFPTESAANANKYIGFDENGNYTAKEGGSGGGQFVVTMNRVAGTWTADKTLTEIVAAKKDGKNVVAVVPVELYGFSFGSELALVTADEVEVAAGVFANAAQFSGVVETNRNNITITLTGMPDEYGADAWSIKEGKVAELPNGTVSQNMLLWDNVQSEWIPGSNPSAPLIVNLTMDTTDPEHPAIVGDKTFGEIYLAHSSGKAVLLKSVDGNEVISAPIVFVQKDYSQEHSQDEVLTVVYFPDKQEEQGALDDYYRIEMA